jgi:hypothetical protein
VGYPEAALKKKKKAEYDKANYAKIKANPDVERAKRGAKQGTERGTDKKKALTEEQLAEKTVKAEEAKARAKILRKDKEDERRDNPDSADTREWNRKDKERKKRKNEKLYSKRRGAGDSVV